MVGMVVVEVPTCGFPVKVAAREILDCDSDTPAGWSQPERELMQVWVRTTGPTLIGRSETPNGWITHDGWVPLDLGSKLEELIESGKGRPAVNLFIDPFKSYKSGESEMLQVHTSAFTRLEGLVENWSEMPGANRVNDAALRAVRAWRAATRMQRRDRVELLQSSGRRQRFTKSP